ncbi:DUF4158 domain-containing protein [Streptomyces sp. NPDC090054]|uniref:DUF4158 domain-containing protein n=1 Tax=Streptomyces sp. NPDC090054 TaxID=3365933 RepID=UPI0038261BF2
MKHVFELPHHASADAKALEAARSKRAQTNRLGWAAQWDCVRMPGVLPTGDPSVVPEAVVRVAATRRQDGRAPEGGGRTRPRPGRTRRVCRGEPDHGGSRAVVVGS